MAGTSPANGISRPMRQWSTRKKDKIHIFDRLITVQYSMRKFGCFFILKPVLKLLNGFETK